MNRWCKNTNASASKGARSFRGQKILKPGHQMQKIDDLFLVVALFTFKKTVQYKANKVVRYGNIFIFCSHYCQSKAMTGDSPARSLARVVDLPARSFDLAHPGVALTLYFSSPVGSDICQGSYRSWKSFANIFGIFKALKSLENDHRYGKVWKNPW